VDSVPSPPERGIHAAGFMDVTSGGRSTRRAAFLASEARFPVSGNPGGLV